MPDLGWGRPERIAAGLEREDWAALCAKMGLPEGTALRWRTVEDLASDGMLIVVDAEGSREWRALLTSRERADPRLDVWPLVLARLQPVAPSEGVE